jgi:NADH dehydrogenase [ubiquinone] 1 alpha subcomplex assembly factor 7
MSESRAAQELAARIAATGAVSIAGFMEIALTGPGGYYTRQDPLGRGPLGAEGDFTTAPEISQMFGELIGLWCVDTWTRMGKPAPFNLIELGPGRGTLMADALRAAKLAPDFLAALHLHLVEVNAALIAAQRERLAGFNPVWCKSLDNLPQGPSIFIANEFFDALPIHQFEMTGDGWRERVVIRRDGGFSFALAAPGPALSLLRPAQLQARTGEIAEVSPLSLETVAKIAAHLRQFSGAMLAIDYGPAQSACGASLQAVKTHRFHHPLQDIGEADLTAHVDFAALADAARSQGLRAFGPVRQGDFLRALGIETRATQLKATAAEALRAEIDMACNRLIDDVEMGKLFKVLAIAAPSIDQLAGI